MKWLMSLAFVMLMAVGADARAQYTVPESGWYWNPALSGSGISIEFQDSSAFVAYYSYDADGEPSFFTTGGEYDVVNRRVSGTLYRTTGGQCIGCPYVRPTQVAIGTATIQFSSLANATVTFTTSAGTASFTVQRFLFTPSYYPTASHQKRGGWAFTIFPSTNSLPWGDAITFSGTTVNSEGVTLSTGTYYPSNRVVVGQPTPTFTGGVNYIVLADFSSTSWALYYGEWTLGHFVGRYELYPKSGSPTFAGYPTVGSRVAGPATLAQIFLATAPAVGDSEIAAQREQDMKSAPKAAAIPLSANERAQLVDAVVGLQLQAEIEGRKRSASLKQ